MTEYDSASSGDWGNSAIWERGTITSSRLSSAPAVPLHNKFRIGQKVRMKKNAEYIRPYPSFLVGKILTIKIVHFRSDFQSVSYSFEGYDDADIYEEDLELVRTCRLNRHGG